VSIIYATNLKDMNSLANSVYMSNHIGTVNSYPEFITVMPLARCNYNCIMCAEAERASDKELSDVALSRLEEALPFARTLFITGGEPLLYTQLERLLKAGSRAGCELWMVSNGSLLTERKCEMLLDAGLAQIKISLDAASPNTYQRIRGGNFMKVLKNIGTLLELRIKRGVRLPEIQLGFVAMRSNIAELGRLAAIAGNLGLDSLYVSTCTIHHEHMLEESLYFHQEYADHHMQKAIEMARAAGIRLDRPPLFSELAAQSMQSLHRDRTTDMCREPWKTIFVRYDGEVNLCCGGGGSCGNLNESSFHEVWNHPARVTARQRVNTPDPLPACRACHTVKQTATNISSHIPNPELARLGMERYGQSHRVAAAV
jgi:MoaA/NifB/PqqE/SkfB family radical SAM enzyme